MSNNNNNNNTISVYGISFTGLLTVAFIVLKLCGVISWSWWWVLSPIWISVGLVIGVLLIIGIVLLIIILCGTIKDNREKKKRAREVERRRKVGRV